jgi:hypothetical protein
MIFARTLTYAVDTTSLIYATKANLELHVTSNTRISCKLSNNKIYPAHKVHHETALNSEGRKEDYPFNAGIKSLPATLTD